MLRKLSVNIKDKKSANIFTNGEYYIYIQNNCIKLQKSNSLMSITIPELNNNDNEFTIVYTEKEILNISPIVKPMNSLKYLFWKYGFRNKMYTRLRSELNPCKNSIKIIDSENLCIYSKKVFINKKEHLSADCIWVNFKNISTEEIYDTEELLKNSAMVELSTINYIFD